MGGGKSGGSGGSVPGFVRESSRELGERSSQLFDLSRPLLEQGSSQIASLIRTGGPNANVPILNNAIAAQQSATQSALNETASNLQRAGVGGNFANRIQNQVQRAGNIAARRIPIEAAVPLIGAATAGALSGGSAAQQGFAGASHALAAGRRQPTRNQAAFSTGNNLFKLALGIKGGAFDGGSGNLFGGKGGASGTPQFAGSISPDF